MFYSSPVFLAEMRGFGEVTSEGPRAMPLAGFRGRTPGQGLWGRCQLFGAQVPAFCPIRSLHAKLITSETNIKLRHISCFSKLRESVSVSHIVSY